MEHDLAGLELALMKQSYLEHALIELCAFQRLYNEELTPKQQEFITTAIHTTACVLNDLLGGISDDD